MPCAERALSTADVSGDHHTAAHLLRVAADDPEYRRQAAAEAAFWERVHPLGLEASEDRYVDGPVERYVNERFTGANSERANKLLTAEYRAPFTVPSIA